MPDTLAGGASLRRPMSVEQYLALSDAKHTEFFDGVCVVNPPTRQHERVVSLVRDAVKAVCPETHEVLTGWGWLTPAGRYFMPDLMVCDVNASDNDIMRYPPPLLVVEVSSPSTRSDDWGVKLVDYARSGATWYWVIDLVDREVVVLENTEQEFSERARFRTRSEVAGPFALDLDPTAFPTP